MTWISVKDRLPENKTLVLCRAYEVEDGKNTIEIIYFVGVFFPAVVNPRFYVDIAALDTCFIDYLPEVPFTVTHWMPIPELSE